jgi:hypothetical protein
MLNSYFGAPNIGKINVCASENIIIIPLHEPLPGPHKKTQDTSETVVSGPNPTEPGKLAFQIAQEHYRDLPVVFLICGTQQGLLHHFVHFS